MNAQSKTKITFFMLLLFLLLLTSACILENTPVEQPPQATSTVVEPTIIEPVLPTATSLPTLKPTTDYGPDYHAIQLAWFYKPPLNGNLESVAQDYSSFILTREDEPARDILKSLGVQAPILQYLYFSAIKKTDSCSDQPDHSTVAEFPGDFCTIAKNHPDWFLKSASGNLITNDTDTTLMDPTNEEWRNFWLERARQDQELYKWDGVFLDNVEATVSKPYEYGSNPPKSLTDKKYQAAIEDGLRFIYTNYFKPQNRPLYANIIALEDPTVWFRYMQYLDGAMIEDFAVGWNDDYKDPKDWEYQLQIIEQTQVLGKKLILVSQGNEFDEKRQLFSLASYLLVNNGNAYFRYTNSDSHNQNWLYEDYKLDLGKPLGNRYKKGGTWYRDFTNGKVSVSPENRTAKIEM
jgi:hypothetical protein